MESFPGTQQIGKSNTTISTVIKLGGSLLTLPDLGSRMEQLLQTIPDIKPLLIVGGGALADIIRDWDQRFPLSEQTGHRLALQTMNVTAGLLPHLIPSAVLVSDLAEATQVLQHGGLPVLQCESLVQSETCDLPESWAVTSDSIAVFVAHCCNAKQVLFLKSVSLPEGCCVSQATSEGLLDDYLPELLVKLSSPPELQWLNLRAFPKEPEKLVFQQLPRAETP